MDNQNISWSALEYEEKERHIDWFWALGVIVFASSVASALFGNYFFALFLVISGFLLGFFAIKKPDMINYQLNDKGLQIQTRLYLFKNIKSFWVRKENNPTLFIKSSRIVVPIISMPIEASLAEKIKETMLAKNIKEEEMKEHPSEKILEALGF